MSTPTTDHFERVATAFSRKAAEYDAFGADHVNLARMRRKVVDHVLRFLQPTDRILELNAGTGIDAAFFARRGYIVHAIDIAPGMLDHLADKIEQQQLHDRLTYQSLSFTEIDRVEGGPYDYLFSNFGGLNCIPDLSTVTQHLPQVLKPGGTLTWVIMPPICPWEMLMIVKGKFRIATRRLRRGGTLAHVEGVHFMTYYFTPQRVLKACSFYFPGNALEASGARQLGLSNAEPAEPVALIGPGPKGGVPLPQTRQFAVFAP